MKNVEKVYVKINLKDEALLVGQLVLDRGIIFFQYHQDYLKKGYNISPYKLKFTDDIQQVNVDFFEGLFGVFADSMPDGWGRLLIDRYLLQQSIGLDQINILTRLCFLNDNSLGALYYEPQEKMDELSGLKDLGLMFKKATEIYDSSIVSVKDFIPLGASSGGARPKAMVFLNKKNIIAHHYQEGYTASIIKFPASSDYEDISKIEYVYNQMAVRAEINVAPFQLLYDQEKNAFFSTKRFDRDGQKRIHTVSAAGLLHDNYRLSNLDYGHIIQTGLELTNDIRVGEQIFRLAIFNILANNKDDHSKNFSFLMNEEGQWSFAPAYDLTYSNTSHGYQSTMVNGKSMHIGYDDFEALARHFKIKKFHTIYEEVNSSLATFGKLARKIGINKEMTEAIQNDLKQSK